MLFYAICIGILVVFGGLGLRASKSEHSPGMLLFMISATVCVPTAALLVFHGLDQLLGMAYESSVPGGSYIVRGVGLGLGIAVGRVWYKIFG